MLLNGWKEIATYLRCGVRTVQRWEALGLPVMRVRPGKRGPVVAQTEGLDAWIRGRNLQSKDRLSPRLAAIFQQAASVREAAQDEFRVLLQNEIRLGLTLAESASRAKNATTRQRRIAMARHAYDSILRLTSRSSAGEVQSKQFSKDLDRLKVTLHSLGENL